MCPFTPGHNRHLRCPRSNEEPPGARSAAESRAAYAAARPFPHAKLDGLFPESLFEAIDREFPDVLDAGPEACNAAQARGWKCFAEKKRGWLKIANSKPKLMGPHLRGVVHAMQSPPFLAFLEAPYDDAPRQAARQLGVASDDAAINAAAVGDVAESPDSHDNVLSNRGCMSPQR